MRIAFISDIHFGKYSTTEDFTVPGEPCIDNTNNVESLERGLIQLIKDNNASYLFIGGDLTSTGSPQELLCCEQKILDIASECGISKDKVIYTLGNHDINWKIIGLSDEFENCSKDHFSKVHEGYRRIASHAPIAVMHNLILPPNPGPVPSTGVFTESSFIVFVLNSSCYCSNKQHNPHGRLDTIQLKWFRNQLEKYENDPRTKIVLLHHHPANYPYPIPGEDASLLEEGSELKSLAGKYGINLILHGHRHHPRATTIWESEWKNPVVFISAGSVSVNCKHRNEGSIPNTAHIIDLSKAPDHFTLYNYQYSLSKGWIKLTRYEDETPLDPVMKVGQIISEERVVDAIKSLPNPNINTTILTYEELPCDLHYLYYDQINDYIQQLLSDRYAICGSFPGNVSLTKRGDINPCL